MWGMVEKGINCMFAQGCMNCNFDLHGNWCVVTNEECDTVERDELGNSEGWAYCNARN